MSERYTPEDFVKMADDLDLYGHPRPAGIGSVARERQDCSDMLRQAAADAEALAAKDAEIARLTAERPQPESDFAQVRATEIPHQRLYDLLRQMRHHLLKEALINLGEFSWLMAGAPNVTGGGSPAPRRLETYDEHEARRRDAESALAAERQKVRRLEDIKQAAFDLMRGPRYGGTDEYRSPLQRPGGIDHACTVCVSQPSSRHTFVCAFCRLRIALGLTGEAQS